MILSNLKIVLPDSVIENGYIEIRDEQIFKVASGSYLGKEEVIDCTSLIAMPGFIDLHIHGSVGIDFMDAKKDDYKLISASLYEEGVTSYLATTLTSDHDSLVKVCESVKEAKKDNPSLLGIHFEGPYISAKYKGAQNEAFIRNPDINELKELIAVSGNNVRYISMAPEKEGALEFVKFASSNGVTVSAGHSDASMDQVGEAIKYGLTNTTHTHNAMSGHHHRNPGVLSAAFYYDNLYREFISDMIHVCPNALKLSYKIIGSDHFMIITDALKAKHSELDSFELFGLPCIKKDGAAYLTSGPLAGSLLSFDQGVRNINSLVKPSLSELSKISSLNQAKSLHLTDRGELKEGKLADIVLLDNNLQVKKTIKSGKIVFSK